MENFSYELGDDGQYHILMFGRRNQGFHPSATEAEAKQRVASMKEESRQADIADAKYSALYNY